jgi:hypothetical protein
MIALLDKTWFAIESVSTHPFADKKMEEQEYLRSFPAMVFYYTVMENYYAGRKVESNRPMSKDEKHVKRSKLLVGYLKKVKERWNQSNYLKKFVTIQAADGILAELPSGMVWKAIHRDDGAVLSTV